MKNYKIIEGKIQNLKIEDSKIHPLKNLDQQAAGTALVGALTSSTGLMSSAPIMLLAAQGVAGKTFIGEINGIKVIGQFTAVKFKEGTPLVMVISEEKEKDRYLAYAILDPKSSLLYMLYGTGKSIKKGYKSLIYNSLLLFYVMLFLFILVVGKVIYDEGLEFFSSFEDILIYGLGPIIFIFVFTFVLMFVVNVKDIHMFGKYSEQMFQILKFMNIEEQDFTFDCNHDDGIHLSVMNYRKNLIGKDPYPEDYFDKKEELSDAKT